MEKIIYFLNGPIIPLAIVILGVICFFVIYSKENKRVNKLREDVQQKINPENEVKHEMVFFNADGTRAPMCGNGIRCLSKFLYDTGLQTEKEYKIDTLSGIMNINVISFEPYRVCINLGSPIFDSKKIDIDTDEETYLNKVIKVNNKEFNVSCVYMATHHLVTIVDSIENVEEKDGYGLCNYPQFTKKINVNFVEIIDRDNIKLKTYERGVGFTKACGTGGAASYVILKGLDLINDKIKNHLEYGILEYEKNGNDIIMTGPSELICNNIKTY